MNPHHSLAPPIGFAQKQLHQRKARVTKHKVLLFVFSYMHLEVKELRVLSGLDHPTDYQFSYPKRIIVIRKAKLQTDLKYVKQDFQEPH